MALDISPTGRFLYKPFGVNRKRGQLQVRFLRETPQHVLQPPLVKANHNIIAGRDDGDAPSP